MKLPDEPIRLRIASSPAHLPVVRAALERFCEMMGFAESVRGGIILSVDEALTNVIRHAYHGQEDRPIEVELRQVGNGSGNSLEIRLRDWGEQVPPERIRPRDLTDVRPGGLGVHIMRTCMDEVSYTPADGGGTVLTMTKELFDE